MDDRTFRGIIERTIGEAKTALSKAKVVTTKTGASRGGDDDFQNDLDFLRKRLDGKPAPTAKEKTEAAKILELRLWLDDALNNPNRVW